MWRPGTWNDITALIGFAQETATLEFKRDITRNAQELAKDIAAMTLNGGVVIYGIDEDPNTQVAARVARVVFQGAEERIQQIVASNIAPPVQVQVDRIRQAPGDADGVIVVVVPPSALTPHQVAGRYPRRDGTTTGYLDEAEVGRLYARREQLTGGTRRDPSDLLDGEAALLPGLPEHRVRSVYHGFAQVRLAARPAAPDVAHAASPWLQDPLTSVVASASARLAQRM